MLVTHKYSVQDEFGNCSVREISQCSVSADIPEKLKSFHMNEGLADQISRKSFSSWLYEMQRGKKKQKVQEFSSQIKF